MKPNRAVWIGGMWHETNSFAADRTTGAQFASFKVTGGPDLIEYFRGTQTEVGGALDVLDRGEVRPLGGHYAGALPSGPISSDAFDEIEGGIIRSLKANEPSAVFLSLHGASVVEGRTDAEGSLVRSIRSTVGEGVPIVATLDLHGNIGPDLVGHTDALVAYDTYPHVDFRERGREAAALLLRTLSGERFARALVQLPMIPPVPAQATAEPPMSELLAAAHALEEDPMIEIVSWLPGFPYSDEPHMGMTLLVVARREIRPEALTEVANALARQAWERRNDFHVRLTAVTSAVAEALTAKSGPVILIDVGDNIGGGSPGDGTALLAELVRMKVSGSVVTIVDPESVNQAIAIGVGRRGVLTVGGKTDDLHGEPVRLDARVEWVGDGAFAIRGSWMTGLSLDPGRSVRVTDVSGVTVVLSERRVPPFDAGQLVQVGIDPKHCRVIVAKSAIAWRAAYGKVAARSIYVDTPGICSPNLKTLPYVNRRKPMWPFEASSYDHAKIHLFHPDEPKPRVL